LETQPDIMRVLRTEIELAMRRVVPSVSCSAIRGVIWRGIIQDMVSALKMEI